MSSLRNNIVKAFAVYTTNDEWGRIGSLVGIYRNFPDAKVGAQGQGWYGSEGRIMEKTVLEDGYDLYVLETEKPMCYVDVEELREAARQKALEAALAKLTPEEIALIKGSN